MGTHESYQRHEEPMSRTFVSKLASNGETDSIPSRFSAPETSSYLNTWVRSSDGETTRIRNVPICVLSKTRSFGTPNSTKAESDGRTMEGPSILLRTSSLQQPSSFSPFTVQFGDEATSCVPPSSRSGRITNAGQSTISRFSWNPNYFGNKSHSTKRPTQQSSSFCRHLSDSHDQCQENSQQGDGSSRSPLRKTYNITIDPRHSVGKLGPKMGAMEKTTFPLDSRMEVEPQVERVRPFSEAANPISPKVANSIVWHLGDAQSLNSNHKSVHEGELQHATKKHEDIMETGVYTNHSDFVSASKEVTGEETIESDGDIGEVMRAGEELSTLPSIFVHARSSIDPDITGGMRPGGLRNSVLGALHHQLNLRRPRMGKASNDAAFPPVNYAGGDNRTGEEELAAQYLNKRLICTQLADCTAVIEINAFKMDRILAAGGTVTQADEWRSSSPGCDIAVVRDTIHTVEVAFTELFALLGRVSLDEGLEQDNLRQLLEPLITSHSLLRRFRDQFDDWSAKTENKAEVFEYYDTLGQFVTVLSQIPKHVNRLSQWVYSLAVWNEDSGTPVFLSSAVHPVPILDKDTNRPHRQIPASLPAKRSPSGDLINSADLPGQSTSSIHPLHPYGGREIGSSSSRRDVGKQTFNIPISLHHVPSAEHRAPKGSAKLAESTTITEATLPRSKVHTESEPICVSGGESTTASSASNSPIETLIKRSSQGTDHGVSENALAYLPQPVASRPSCAEPKEISRENNQDGCLVIEEDDLASVMGDVDSTREDKFEETKSHEKLPRDSLADYSTESIKTRLAEMQPTSVVPLSDEEREIFRLYMTQLTTTVDELNGYAEEFFSTMEDLHGAKRCTQAIQMMCIKAQTIVCVIAMVCRNITSTISRDLCTLLDHNARLLEERTSKCIDLAKAINFEPRSITSVQAMASAVITLCEAALDLKQFWLKESR